MLILILVMSWEVEATETQFAVFTNPSTLSPQSKNTCAATNFKNFNVFQKVFHQIQMKHTQHTHRAASALSCNLFNMLPCFDI